MIYNTDYDQVQTYTQTAWSGITGNKDLGIECASAMDCASGFCVDSVCCDTSTDNCSGDCHRCNVAGSMGICSNVDSLCTGNCDICSSGNCIADAALCTGDCDVCSGSDMAYSCAASNALCSNTTASCGCSGSGTVFNCSSCPDTYGVCGHPTCSSYTCGNAYDNGVACSTCHTCSSGSCTAHVPAGSTGLNCTAAHYRCDGSGNCTRPCGSSILCTAGSYSKACFAVCRDDGPNCGCVNCYYNSGCTSIIYPDRGTACPYGSSDGNPIWCGCVGYLY